MKNIVVVYGYPRYDIVWRAMCQLDKVRASYRGDLSEVGTHVYPYNSEGAQLYVISDTPLTDGEVSDGTFAFFDSDQVGEHDYIPDEPIQYEGPNTEQQYLAVAWLHGYEADSDDLYEA